MDERNSKLLQTLSEATDMLAKADEMQAPGGMSRQRKIQRWWLVGGWLVDQLGAQYVLGDHRSSFFGWYIESMVQAGC